MKAILWDISDNNLEVNDFELDIIPRVGDTIRTPDKRFIMQGELAFYVGKVVSIDFILGSDNYINIILIKDRK